MTTVTMMGSTAKSEENPTDRRIRKITSALGNPAPHTPFDNAIHDLRLMLLLLLGTEIVKGLALAVLLDRLVLDLLYKPGGPFYEVQGSNDWTLEKVASHLRHRASAMEKRWCESWLAGYKKKFLDRGSAVAINGSGPADPVQRPIGAGSHPSSQETAAAVPSSPQVPSISSRETATMPAVRPVSELVLPADSSGALSDGQHYYPEQPVHNNSWPILLNRKSTKPGLKRNRSSSDPVPSTSPVFEPVAAIEPPETSQLPAAHENHTTVYSWPNWLFKVLILVFPESQSESKALEAGTKKDGTFANVDEKSLHPNPVASDDVKRHTREIFALLFLISSLCCVLFFYHPWNAISWPF